MTIQWCLQEFQNFRQINGFFQLVCSSLTLLRLTRAVLKLSGRCIYRLGHWCLAQLQSHHHPEPWVLLYSPLSFHFLSSYNPSLPLLYLLPHLAPVAASASMTAPAQKTPCWPTSPDCRTSQRAGRAARRTPAASSSPSTTSSRSTQAPASSSPPAPWGDQAPASGFRGQEIVPSFLLRPPLPDTSGTSRSWFARKSETGGAGCSFKESQLTIGCQKIGAENKWISRFCNLVQEFLQRRSEAPEFLGRWDNQYLSHAFNASTIHFISKYICLLKLDELSFTVFPSQNFKCNTL